MADNSNPKSGGKAAGGSALGDIIGATRQRLEQPQDPAARLRDLVAATTPGSPPRSPEAVPLASQPHAVLPTNYFPQVSAESAWGGLPSPIVPKRKPQRGPARSLHISMRLSPIERDRLVRWCEERNLSLPDGVMALLDLAESTVA